MDILGISTNYKDFVYALGYFSEYITFLITCLLIYNQYVYFFFYLIIFVFNRIINTFIKNIIKEERPNNPKKFLDSDKFNIKKYGNPSGHTQLSVFSFIYAYLVLGKMPKLLIFSLIACIVTIYERYSFRNHTLNQLLSGVIVGFLVAYVSYSVVNYIHQKQIM